MLWYLDVSIFGYRGIKVQILKNKSPDIEAYKYDYWSIKIWISKELKSINKSMLWYLDFACPDIEFHSVSGLMIPGYDCITRTFFHSHMTIDYDHNQFYNTDPRDCTLGTSLGPNLMFFIVRITNFRLNCNFLSELHTFSEL